MSSERILIVEDENIVALDMQVRLEAMGYRVCGVADTGSAALARAAEAQPDLALVDIKLKGDLDGIDVARRLRDASRIPVVFVTAFTDEGTLERAKPAGPYGFLVKPFHERELRIAIELAISKFRLERAMVREKELAEESNRLKGEFLANMSHELKTPLNSLIGFVQLASGRAADEEQAELLRSAAGSAQLLLELIERILQLSRLEAGRLSPLRQAFDLDEVLGECVDALAVGAAAKGFEAGFRRDSSLPARLVGDEALLRQILRNLVDNAVKFTSSGRVRVAAFPAEPGALASAGDLAVAFRVSDTGIGMPPEKIEKAFERFSQLDGSKTRRAGGAGLGLAIVKKDVDVLGGRVEVASLPGAGTSVLVILPFDIPEGSGDERPPLSDKRAVVVGFEPEAGSDAAEIASGLGAEVRLAGTLREALRGEDADLLICDEKCGDLDGLSVDGQLAGRLEGRLAIAARFGSEVRSRVGPLRGLAFLPFPPRGPALERAYRSLQASGQGAPAGEPAAPGAPGGSLTDGARKRLAELAEQIGAAGASSDFSQIERDLKSLREACQDEGFAECERLVFNALLLARKSDVAGLRGLAERAKSLALRAVEP